MVNRFEPYFVAYYAYFTVDQSRDNSGSEYHESKNLIQPKQTRNSEFLAKIFIRVLSKIFHFAT